MHRSNAEFFGAVRDWWRPHQAYGMLAPMRPGITAALWLGPAQEYSRYWIGSAESRMARGVVEAFADAAWKVLRNNEIEETR